MKMPIFAMEVTPPDIDVSGMTSNITGAFSQYFTVDNLIIILVAALGTTAALAIAWFAYRFIKRKVAGAMKKGSI